MPTLVGIDHAFSFPLRYFEEHKLPPEWSAFLDDFSRHWPTDEDHVYVDFVRDGVAGHGAARTGNNRWRRLTEERAGGAKSVFHFDVTGQVAKSSHAGIPWIRFLRDRLGEKLHCWPFDGWQPRAGLSVLVEVYPSLWRHAYEIEDRTPDQHDAYVAAMAMQAADAAGRLERMFAPQLTPNERALAEVEGWILGVEGDVEAAAGARQARSTPPAARKLKRVSRPLGYRSDAMTLAREFLARRIRLQYVETPPPFYDVDPATTVVFLISDDQPRVGGDRYVVVNTITGEVRLLGVRGE